MESHKFLDLWNDIKEIFDEVIKKYDGEWMLRKRSIDTRFLLCFILQIIIPKDHRGYGVTLVEIFNQFLNLGLPSVSKRALAASSLCEARQKLNPLIFKELNGKIIAKWEQYNDKPALWHGHRLFGVDGSKFTLPRELIIQGYKTPGDHAHYPQGLVSGMYDLLTGIPYDFDMVNHNNERMCVIRHLKQGFQKNAVHVYDRGYFSFEVLFDHLKNAAHAVFRLQKNTGYQVIEEFWNSKNTDEIVTLQPPMSVLKVVRDQNLDIDLNPIEVRLIKYIIGEASYVLCTTLVDKIKYPTEIFPDVYHSRWGVEEMYKVSKVITGVQDFHSKSESGCKQELFAHFLLITMMKIIESQSHYEIEEREKSRMPPKKRLRTLQKREGENPTTEFSETNEANTFSASMLDFTKNKMIIENENKSHAHLKVFKINTRNSFLSSGAEMIKLLYFESVEIIHIGATRLCESAKRLYQKIRPGRSFPRKSKQAPSKWCKAKPKIA